MLDEASGEGGIDAALVCDHEYAVLIVARGSGGACGSGWPRGAGRRCGVGILLRLPGDHRGGENDAGSTHEEPRPDAR